ncbi:hypothetical protein P7C70_g887, partial [Phenoliferia sp. Uapishka_3]
MVSLDKAIGSLLIGSWVNTILYTMEAVQVYKYFSDYANDTFILKGAVGLAFSVDTFATFAYCAGVYLNCVTHWGDASYLLVQNLAIPTYCFTTAVTTFIVQAFMCARAGRMIQNKYIRMPMIMLLIALSLSSVASAFWAGISVLMYPNYTERQKEVIPVTIWMTTTSGADIGVAITLIIQLMHVQKKYSDAAASSRLGGILNSLIWRAIQTGSVTALFAILCLCLYLTDQKSNVTIGTGFSLARIYSLTMLVNLNSRRSLAEKTTNSGSASSGDNMKGFSFQPKNKLKRHPALNVSIDHQRTVDVEGPHTIHLESFESNNRPYISAPFISDPYVIKDGYYPSSAV